jgi:hypothetical protein
MQAGGPHQPGHALAAVPVPLAAQLRMDPRGTVAALGRLVGLADVLGELVVGALACRRGSDAVGVVGGPGDLQQHGSPAWRLRCCAFSASMNG